MCLAAQAWEGIDQALAHKWLLHGRLQFMELSSHQFFSFFDPDVAENLRKFVTVTEVPARTVIFEEGERSDCLYLVLSGKVELCKRASERSRFTIAFAGENDFFGELEVLDGSARNTHAIAVDGTTLGRVDRKPILAALRDASGKTVIDLLNRTIQRLRLTGDRHVAAVMRTEKITLLGEMAGTIIHDLRNPCHAVSMAGLLIQRLHTDEKTVRCCHIIQGQVHRMVTMVEELLEFARGNYRLNRQTLSLAVLLESFALLQRDYLQQNNIELELEPANVSVHVDGNKILRVLHNLLRSAADGLKEQAGRVTISGRNLASEVEICLRDDGPGIPDHIQSQLFDPFVTSGKRAGTGLELAMARSIIEAHGGGLRCESKPGEGAAFYMRLPAA